MTVTVPAHGGARGPHTFHQPPTPGTVPNRNVSGPHTGPIWGTALQRIFPGQLANWDLGWGLECRIHTDTDPLRLQAALGHRSRSVDSRIKGANSLPSTWQQTGEGQRRTART